MRIPGNRCGYHGAGDWALLSLHFFISTAGRIVFMELTSKGTTFTQHITDNGSSVMFAWHS
jgi:hypothetical protein